MTALDLTGCLASKEALYLLVSRITDKSISLVRHIQVCKQKGDLLSARCSSGFCMLTGYVIILHVSCILLNEIGEKK